MQLSHRAERFLLALILSLNLLLGFTYALVTPAFEASDELWHYPMVQHLAGGNPLPVQVFDPALAGPWNQEASQPPLYYYLGAALTFWIDQSDMAEVRRLNPHVDNGVITSDGNTNLAVHDPSADPWHGALLAVRVVRLFSVLLGTATVYLTYRIAREVTPDRPEVALTAAALNAFLPMFLFISGAVNNDNLAIPLSSLAILLMIRIVTRGQRSGYSVQWWEWALLGVVIGLAALTKEGTLGLIPLAVGTAFVATWQRAVSVPRFAATGDQPMPVFTARIWAALGRLLVSLILIAAPIILIAGWWYYRNIVLYGDWLGWNAFIAVLGQRAHPASLSQLWGERHGFMMSFWGLFGGVNIPMEPWIYTSLNALLVLAVFGFAVYLARLLVTEWRLFSASREPWYAKLLRPVERNFGLIVILLFAAAVVFGLVQWATTTWSSQGRLVFTAISALCILTALGWFGLVDLLDLTGFKRPVRSAIVAVPLVFLFLVAALAPWVWIRPAYQPPVYTGPLPWAANSPFGEQMRLAGYELLGYSDLRPGDQLRVRLEWETLRPMERDWSVFVHLNDPVLGLPIAQRDMYPGQGLLSTRRLMPGQRLVNDYVLTIPPTAVAPADLELAVGLYNFATGERLRLPDNQDAVVLATLPLEPAEGPYPNPVAVRFEHGLELVGYGIEPRRVSAGKVVDLVTYWRASQPLPDDFTFFAQLVGRDTTRYAAADVAHSLPTSSWTPGEVVEIHLPLAVDPATPPDAYPLIVGLYTRTSDGGFDRLQLVTPDGRLTDDFLTLTPVRVDTP